MFRQYFWYKDRLSYKIHSMQRDHPAFDRESMQTHFFFLLSDVVNGSISSSTFSTQIYAIFRKRKKLNEIHFSLFVLCSSKWKWRKKQKKGTKMNINNQKANFLPSPGSQMCAWDLFVTSTKWNVDPNEIFDFAGKMYNIYIKLYHRKAKDTMNHEHDHLPNRLIEICQFHALQIVNNKTTQKPPLHVRRRNRFLCEE